MKRYGCLFTCFVTRAVHIEVAHSLELDSFICALQRFISRRGKPVALYSDNGTNFHGGNRELRESIEAWNKEKLHSNLIQQDIEWHFNPPNASHMGGVWERMIRSTRRILMMTMKEQVVSDEALLTYMAEAEKIINDRPITMISDGPRDPEPYRLVNCCCSEAIHVFHLECLARPTRTANVGGAMQAQYLADIFWKRWVREYLVTLQQRQKWFHEERNFEVDDIVLVSDDNIGRGQWPLGRVLETYPDAKGQVRTVKVRVGGTNKVRPIHKLVLLEGDRS